MLRGEVTDMGKIDMDKLIYCDVEFISLKYEEVTGDSPSSQMTRTEGMKAGLGIPVLSAGIHTQETRTYSMSSFGMLNKVYESLEKYTDFDSESYSEKSKPEIAWVRGNITVSIWRNPKNQEDDFLYFQMLGENNNSDFSLITKKEYTSSAYDSLFDISPALQNNINIPVSALVKILYYSTVAKSFVTSPILIVERKS